MVKSFVIVILVELRGVDLNVCRGTSSIQKHGKRIRDLLVLNVADEQRKSSLMTMEGVGGGNANIINYTSPLFAAVSPFSPASS